MTKPAPGPDQPPVPVRLITFNTHHGVGEDSRHDLPRLAKVLASVEADVICLQEVDRYFGERSEDVDQALLLSRALDMQLAWGPAIDEPRAGEQPPRQYGNALLSRLPILISSVHPLPGAAESRGALQTMVELDGGALWVTAASLGTGPAQERAEQVAALAALHSEPMETGVVVGDLGTAADAPELAALRERFVVVRAQAERAGRRIDQVWASAGVRVTAARVLDGDGASDLLPFVVDLQVRSGV